MVGYLLIDVIMTVSSFSDKLDHMESELCAVTAERDSLAAKAKREKEDFEQLNSEFARSQETAERQGLESQRLAIEFSVIQNQLLILQARSR